jgi:hypothetical protein
LNNHKPKLVTVIDTEEEFNWSAPFTRDKHSTKAVANLTLLQNIFDKYHVKPIYAVTYPIAEDPKAIKLISKWLSEDKCEIGVQLHPWVTPPYKELTDQYNSYPGNLPSELEYQKIKNLRDLIHKNFGIKPKYYKAGRYGFGVNTARILKELGFDVDLSILPHTNLACQEGPNFLDCADHPDWLDEEKKLFEIPLTKNFTGLLSGIGKYIHHPLQSNLAKKLKLSGILAKLGLLNLPTLTAEGITVKECIDLTKQLLKNNHNIFHYTLHSSSLLPGGSPYVKTDEDLKVFLQKISDYYHYFQSIGGEFISPIDLKRKSSI